MPRAAPYQIRVADTEYSYFCEPGENILRAGLRAGIGIPYECNAGGCGSCKIELVTGEIEDLMPAAPGIRARERKRNRVLACQCTPLTNCEIRTRVAPEFIAPVPSLRFEARFVASRDITADIREFVFAAVGPSCFLPGQYAVLNLPSLHRSRAYSMSNQPNKAGEWGFMIRRVPDGLVSNYLFDVLKIGDSIYIEGPLGLAYLRPHTSRDIVCVAGGSGLAPVVSIVNAQQSGEPGPGTRWLFYGGRGPADIPEFGQLILTGTPTRVHTSVSVAALAAGAGWRGDVCFVHELLERNLPAPLATYDYYLAGPPPMIEVLVRMLVAQKVSLGSIRYDRFF
ncbi:oxidoreductase FAD-binding subunit [Caballeronia udeis]|uniref:Oxidoreductase FAD-binding subunit n=1 Tax=Caballeronia udeis TaxID=1232866 RepID=A0A158JJQ3_9BURK|nr:2Fe-2S iron-sulfur cluster binding domain-containing protein [Caballeronia udeis]SAL68681.1 oxidoreductase FAD-binding subunit [Caballeronia udeis]